MSESVIDVVDDLSLAQRYAFQQFKIGTNLLVSGPAGTGKSFFISKCKEFADATSRPFQITATTGAAAVLLGQSAKTIHSWGGLGIGSDPAEKIIFKMKYKARTSMAIKMAFTLVIDEISMMSKEMFELASEVFSAVRNDSRPFGGLQLILCGDFFQLPPIGDRSRAESGAFCFESKVFRSMFNPKLKNMVALTQIFRQVDPVFSRVLNEIRVGEVSEEGDALLRTRLNIRDDAEDGEDVVRPTRIYPKRDAVDFINMTELGKLKTVSVKFKMLEHFETNLQEVCKSEGVKVSEVDTEFSFMRRNLLCDDEIELKVGAQVMNIRNTLLPDNTLLANGAQGVVIGFNNDAEGRVVPLVRFECGVTMLVLPKFFESSSIKKMGLIQLPLRLAWAVTIHKAQGATLDKAEMDLGSSLFAPGQTYSAISRLRTIGGLFLTAYDPSKVVAHAGVKEFYKSIPPVTEDMLLSEEAVVRLTASTASKFSAPPTNVERPFVDLFSQDSGSVASKRKRVDIFSDDATEKEEHQTSDSTVKTIALNKASPFERFKL